jgi:hypothetical protein
VNVLGAFLELGKWGERRPRLLKQGIMDLEQEALIALDD